MIRAFLSSTVGKKVIVALTGAVMVGFLVGHLAGNLLVFAGPETFNHYSATLKANPMLLWGVRLLLLVSVIAHVVFTFQLTLRNKLSRPVAYHQNKTQQAVWGSTFMALSGLFLAAYIIYHLLHFTFGTAHPAFNEHDVYANVITGFRVTWTSCIYILAMIALGFHLNHGVRSLFQTLGLNHPKYNSYRAALATILAVGIPGGFICIPVAVLMGVLK